MCTGLVGRGRTALLGHWRILHTSIIKTTQISDNTDLTFAYTS